MSSLHLTVGQESMARDRLSCLPPEILRIICGLLFRGIHVIHKSDTIYKDHKKDPLTSLLMVSRRIGTIARMVFNEYATVRVPFFGEPLCAPPKEPEWKCPFPEFRRGRVKCECFEAGDHLVGKMRNSCKHGGPATLARPRYEYFKLLRTECGGFGHRMSFDSSIIDDIVKVLETFSAMTCESNAGLLAISIGNLFRVLEEQRDKKPLRTTSYYRRLGAALCNAASRSSAQVLLYTRFYRRLPDPLFPPPSREHEENAFSTAVRLGQHKPPVPLLCDLRVSPTELIDWLFWHASLPKEVQTLYLYLQHVERVKHTIADRAQFIEMRTQKLNATPLEESHICDMARAISEERFPPLWFGSP